ncbi:glycoprotein M [Bovine gammaherpesvirus 6]|uniref:Glycoprotein M n=1 Tax=Bovine gammaherpesvirus 6 TaxID=1504288 RepID=A0A060CXL3_9GAMA|nr:glycoprotein M [Bovine gammaherpesvirus 6]AIB03193.1 glycoprotein M [Bovine gammaherpesvirus 6]
MKSSKKDIFVFKIWLKLMACYFIMFITSAVVPIAAMFPSLGFPCSFNSLVDYSSMNLRSRNQARHLTPTLFLEAPEMFFYVTASFIIDCCSLVYYICTAVAIIKARKHADGLTVLSHWILSAGSPTLVYMAIFKLWTIQLFIHTLSYKHIYLAAFVYCIHWLLSVVSVECYITNVSSTWSNSELRKSIPEGSLLYRVIHVFKPILINIHLACMALETLIFCLSFMMAIGNSFYVMVSDIVFGAINLYVILPIAWYIVTEVWLVRYLKYQFGFYFGVLAASVILILPLIRYERIFVAARVHKAVALNISIIPMCALVAFLFRACRVYFGRKKIAYSSLKTNRNIEKVYYSKKAPAVPTKQGPASSVFLQEESDSEFEE